MSWESSETSATGLHGAVHDLIGLTLHGRSSYSIMKFIGEGCFGKVVKCQNVATQEEVAIKIMKNWEHAEREVAMLEMIRSLSSIRTNIVLFLETFESMGLTCLAFEMLDLSLSELLERREWEPLSVSEIRPVAQQMFVALNALKHLGVLHTDIKPDNIMLVNLRKGGLRVKLIDFGRAIPACLICPGMRVQPLKYRAPEVSLGLPYCEAIDIWGLGCVLASLYLAEHLFPTDSSYQMMKCMVQLLGQPDDHMLRTGMYTEDFFFEVQAGDCTSWRLMEFVPANDIEPLELSCNMPSSVDGLFDMYEETEAAESEDRRAFLDLLKRMLHLDWTQRISPHQALQHSFITMSILAENPDYSAYLTTARAQMRVCSPNSSSDEPSPKSSDEFTASYDKDSWVSSDEGGVAYSRGETINSTEEALCTSVLKRIHRFFRQAVAHFTCCIRPDVDD